MDQAKGRLVIAMLAVAALVMACAETRPSQSWTTGPTIAPPEASAEAPVATTGPEPTLAPPAATALRLMDFNIEYGGDEVDFTKVIEAIVAADPDVVALEEAEGNTARVAEALGWPYHSVRSQLVSKLPLIDPPGADGLYEYVEVAPGQVVAIANVHLPSDPYGPYLVRDGEPIQTVLETERSTRLAALQPRLDAAAKLVASGIPTFITGDFNSPSHLDWTEAAVGLREHVLYPVDWPVTRALEDAGFRDAYRELHPDPVADPGLTWWAARPLIDGYPDPSEPQDRIDMIFAGGAATPTSTSIVGETGGPQVDIAVEPWGTDHRGVVADLDVTPGVPGAFVAVDRHLATVGDDVVARYRTPGTSGERVVVRPTDDPAGAPVVDVALTAGTTDGTTTIPTAAITPGDYEVQLLHATGGVTSRTPLHVAAPGATASLTLGTPSVASGEPIVVTVSGAPGARWDWLGLYPRGGDPNVDDYLYYAYTGSNVSTTVTMDETGEGEWPLAPGEYDVLLLSDDGYVELARTPLTITP